VSPRPVAASLALLAAVGLLAGCSSQQDRYCSVVEDHQAELTEVAASDDPGAVFEALDAYDDLADAAPRDVADDWQAVVGPLHDLETALDSHDLDPSTYAADDPPAGLDDAAREDVEAAARAVGSAATVEAMASVEQHALDVCGTPLAR
jgi:hypothetical protein